MSEFLTEIPAYLWDQSWQIVIVFSLIACACRVLRDASAHWRYLLWLVVLAKCLVPPLVTIPLAVFPVAGPAEKASSELTPTPASTAANPAGALASPLLPGTSSIGAAEVTPDTGTVGREAPLSWTGAQWLGLGWFTGAFLLGLFCCARALKLRRLLQSTGRAASASLEKEVTDLAARVRLKQSPRVFVSDAFSQPFVWGLLRGSIYLPTHFAHAHTTEQRRAVLMHELSHVARWDAAFNLLQNFVQCLFFFHPLVWWANASIRREREKCCDELAIASLGVTPSHYSAALVDSLAAMRPSSLLAPSLAVTGQTRNFVERIETIMRKNKRFYRGPTGPAVTAALVFAILTGPTSLVLTAQEQPKGATPDTAARRSNVVMVPCVQKYSVMLVVGEKRITFEGQETSWTRLPAMLKKVPHRDRTYLAVGVATASYNNEAKRRELMSKVARLYRGTGLEGLSFVGRHSLGDKGGARFEPIITPQELDAGKGGEGAVRKPGVVMVPCVRKYSVMLVTGKDGTTFEGKKISWEGLPEVLRNVPRRDKTILAVAVADAADDTEAKYLKLLSRVNRLSKGSGLGLSFVGHHPLGAKGGTWFEPVVSPQASKTGLSAAEPVTNMVPCVRKYSIMLVVGKERMTFEGRDVTWQTLPAMLKELPHRARTTLAVGVADASDVNEAKRRELMSKAARSYKGLGFEGLSFVGQHPLGSRGGARFEPVITPQEFDAGKGKQ